MDTPLKDGTVDYLNPSPFPRKRIFNVPRANSATAAPECARRRGTGRTGWFSSTDDILPIGAHILEESDAPVREGKCGRRLRGSAKSIPTHDDHAFVPQPLV